MEEAERDLQEVREQNYPGSHEPKILVPLATTTENRGIKSAPQDTSKGQKSKLQIGITSNLNEENPGVNQTSQQTQLYSIPNGLDNLSGQQ